MSYTAKDGRRFPTTNQGRKYDQSLEENTLASKGQRDFENAPGGEEHVDAIREHGVVTQSTIKYEGNGRWRHTAVHQDGATSTSVHPQWHRAQEIQGKYFDPDGKPPALETHQKARSHPAGPKEEARIAREDGREPEELVE